MAIRIHVSGPTAVGQGASCFHFVIWLMFARLVWAREDHTVLRAALSRDRASPVAILRKKEGDFPRGALNVLRERGAA